MATINLGPFAVHHPIGSGGMGSVWAGEHLEQKVPVAIKVINVDQARRATYLRAFRNEVRSVAGLDHPGVVMVFDHGTVPPEAENLSGGRMIQGSPYLVMEKASGGALDEAHVDWTWTLLEEVLFGLLDALGHAHARGVVHRDLKPGNVLVCTEDDPRPGIKLADFGLSHAKDVALRGASSYSGTPRYMAPEQFQGRWRDYGAWTDLYALGCMAFEVVNGHPPFRGNNYAQLRQGHLYADAQPLTRGPGVPEGLGGWVHRLLDKDPGQRFQSAADAAWALWKLDPPADPQAPLSSLDRQPMNRTVSCTLAFGELRSSQATATQHFYEDTAPSEQDLDSEGDLGPPPDDATSTLQPAFEARAPVEVPPMPKDWRRPAERRSMRLVGTGLGLYGLRQVPLVARDEERDAIWRSLAKVRQTGKPQALVFRGPGGVGKSRVVQWMAERVREVGSAQFLWATHSPRPGPRDGLEGMISRHLGCAGLSHDDTLRRIERHLLGQGVTDPYEWQALTEMLVPRSATDTNNAVVFFSRPEERYILLRRLLKRLDRPALIWLDQAHLGPDAQAFVEYLLQTEDTPALVVLTVREGEELPLTQHPRCGVKEVGRLGQQARRELIQELLMLEGEVATQVEERTGGNPLFAIQLVGDWVQRGILLPGPRGFVLESGAAVDIPDDLHVLWEARLADVLRPGERRALELAAVLGAAIDEQEWRVALGCGGLSWPVGLVDRLVDRQLARRDPSGWAFSHPLMRESLERSARETGDQGLHAACAEMLSALYRDRRRGVPARRGAHLVAAGRDEEALDPLLLGSEQARQASEYAAAHRLLDERSAAVTRLGLGSHDPRVGQGWLARARVLTGTGQAGKAGELAQRAVQHARDHAWLDLVPRALRVSAQAASYRGDLIALERLALEGIREAQTLGDRESEAHGRRLASVVAQRRGDATSSLRLAREAYALFEQLRDPRGMADALNLMALGEASAGRADRAGELLRQAVQHFEQCGSQYGLASAYNNLAELLRKEGDADGAESGFRMALTTYRRLGSTHTIVPLLNLAIVLTERDQHAPAREHLRAALRLTGASPIYHRFAHALSLPSAAVLGSWRRWSAHIAGAQDLTRRGVFDADVAGALQQAGLLAARADRWDEARSALELARSQWAGLGRDWERQRVEEALATMG